MYNNNKIHFDKGENGNIKVNNDITIGTALCHKHLVHIVKDINLVTCKTCLQIYGVKNK